MNTTDPKLGQVVMVDSNSRRDDFAFERSQWEPLGIGLTVANCTTEAEIIAAAQEADVLAYGGLYTSITARVIEALTRCRLIVRYGIGVEGVDFAAATEHGILVANAAEYCVPEVADHATALILALARRIVFLDRHVQRGEWSGGFKVSGPLPRLSTTTLGLVGFGRIARRVAQNMQALVGNIVATDPYVSQEAADALGVELVSLEELLERADFVSVHTPLLSDTQGLIGAAELAHMKPTAYIVNTSRGPVIDETALIEALQQGKIAGAGLDVVEQEPLAADSPLRTLDNVILTPHFAAYSEQAVEDLRASVVQTVSDVLQGKWPLYVMNPKVQPRVALRRREGGRNG